MWTRIVEPLDRWLDRVSGESFWLWLLIRVPVFGLILLPLALIALVLGSD